MYNKIKKKARLQRTKRRIKLLRKNNPRIVKEHLKKHYKPRFRYGMRWFQKKIRFLTTPVLHPVLEVLYDHGHLVWTYTKLPAVGINTQ